MKNLHPTAEDSSLMTKKFELLEVFSSPECRIHIIHHLLYSLPFAQNFLKDILIYHFS